MTDEHALALAAIIAAAAEAADADAALTAWLDADDDDLDTIRTLAPRLRTALEALYAAVSAARACGALR